MLPLWVLGTQVSAAQPTMAPEISTASTAQTLTPAERDLQWMVATAAFAPRSANALRDVNIALASGPYRPAKQRRLESTDDADVGKDFTYVSQSLCDDWLARPRSSSTTTPDVLYFNWWAGSSDFRETERRFAAFYYDAAAERHQEVVMNYKHNNMRDHSGAIDVERGQLAGIRSEAWQTDTSLSNESWATWTTTLTNSASL